MAQAEPGLYPQATVDGSPATVRSPAAARAVPAVDPGRGVHVGTVRPARRKRPTSSIVEVSADFR
ncbi:hypothetical protein [Streptomyces sp. NPDC005251]|uniref:hypothetical protein n=1 Tax=unclassified Streptomyces TaxID=2593676 RepID=UPI00339EF90E